MAQAFDQGVRDATQHPIIVIISSAKAIFIQGSSKKNTYSCFVVNVQPIVTLNS